MYVFDSEDNLMNHYIYDKQYLHEFQGAKLDLTSGTYRIVAWGNISEYSKITGESGFSAMRLYHPDYLNGNVIRNFDSLYYSSDIITISPGHDSDTPFFRSAHINMEIYVEGFDSSFETRALIAGLIEITNANVGYDFGMNLTGETSSVYPLCETDSNEEIAFAEFDLLRFRNDTPIKINILDSNGDVYFTVDIEKFLKDNDIDVENVQEITVPIHIKFDDISVSVSVADWGSNNVKPVF
ncbi:MAG: FimB/Mfa2 family fimbrial subunit [Rikenellaceae bacterium]|nr:FimB/Mfa2 family fimbrial subunit [Rikenellaceae bacterium]